MLPRKICILPVLNMVRRNLYFAPKSVKETAYISTVRPITEYASTVWSPNSEQLKQTIEVVQNNAAKFILNKYPKKSELSSFSSSALVEDLGWESFEWRRIRSRCCMAYKILHGQTLIPPDSIKRSSEATRRLTRSCQEPTVGWENALEVPRTKTKTYDETFYVNTPEVWNKYVKPQTAVAMHDSNCVQILLLNLFLIVNGYEAIGGL